MTIRIVDAKVDQAGEIAKFAALTFGETFVGRAYYTQQIVDGYAKSSLTHEIFRSYLEDSKHRLYLAEVDREFAGLAHMAERDRPECVRHLNAIYLNRLYMKKEFKGRGLGKLLLSECYNEAKKRGYDWMWLSVWEHNTPAIAFYEHLGFRKYGDWDWPFESHGVKYNDCDFLYAMRLP